MNKVAFKQKLQVKCFTFWARTQEKLGVYFCEVYLFSDSAKTKHIYEFNDGFIEEERRKLFFPAAPSWNFPGLTVNPQDQLTNAISCGQNILVCF